jgi:hypothetical protein
MKHYLFKTPVLILFLLLPCPGPGTGQRRKGDAGEHELAGQARGRERTGYSPRRPGIGALTTGDTSPGARSVPLGESRHLAMAFRIDAASECPARLLPNWGSATATA